MEGADELEAELARSRESALRLLENLGQKLGAIPALHNVTQYWQEHSASEIAGDVHRAVRRNPVPAIAAALVAGFLLGRALEVRRRSRFD